MHRKFKCSALSAPVRSWIAPAAAVRDVVGQVVHKAGPVEERRVRNEWQGLCIVRATRRRRNVAEDVFNEEHDTEGAGTVRTHSLTV